MSTASSRTAPVRASVIIPTYNCREYLEATLQSVLPQITAQDEVIIVDDGSTDNTLQIIEPYLSNNVRYYWRTNSGGPAAPRNLGISKARGELIFIFDSDDLMLPGKLEKTIAAAEHNPDAAMFFTNFRTIDEDGKILEQRFLDTYEITGPLAASKAELIPAKTAYYAMTKENYVGTSGVAIRRSALETVGGFDESLTNSDDRDMWFRIMNRFNVVYIPEELHCYRIRENSISTATSVPKIESRLKVLLRQLTQAKEPRIRKQLQHLVAENYKAVAWQLQMSGQMARSRQAILHALRYEFQSSCLRLFIRSFLPQVVLNRSG